MTKEGTADRFGRSLSYVCRGTTTFGPDGRFDEIAFKQHMVRFVEPDIGVYVASSGSGAGQALNLDDLFALYRAAVEVGKGKITIGANLPEQFTSALSIEHAHLAMEANVDLINIYGPDGRHGFNPTDREYVRYFDRILSAIDWPISLCPNPVLGYQPKPTVMAEISRNFPQVENIVLTGMSGDDTYFMELQELVEDRIKIYVKANGSLNSLLMGAAGLAGHVANLIPMTFRRYLDAVTSGDMDGATDAYRDIRRIDTYTSRWRPSHGVPRWHSMFLKALRLPGHQGILPDPYLMPDDAEIERFSTGLFALNVSEINNMAADAGVNHAIVS